MTHHRRKHHGKRHVKRWIQAAMRGRKKNRGALHRQLHVPAGKNIPREKLVKAAKKGGKLGRRARFALTMRKLHKKRAKKHHHRKHHTKGRKK
jgi:hypothetical protein